MSATRTPGASAGSPEPDAAADATREQAPEVSGPPGPPAPPPPRRAEASAAHAARPERHHFGLRFQHSDRGPSGQPAVHARPAGEQPSPGTPSATSQPSAATYRRRRLVAGGVALAVVAVLAVGLTAGIHSLGSVFSSAPADYPGPGSGSTVVVVHSGDTLSLIGDELAAAGVVKSARAFTTAAAGNAQATGIQPGYYQLTLKIPGSQALSQMLDPASRVDHRVSVPEGSTAKAVAALLASKAKIPLADTQALVTTPTGLTLAADCHGHVEGCLFPATYDFPPQATAQQALQAMLDRFASTAEDMNLDTRAAAIGRTPYEVLVTASIIQAESKFPDEYPKVARVIYNRLAANMPLGMDSTINYVLPERKEHLSSADLATSSPYNTYKVKGLPPTPIGNPGQDALQAALSPADGTWLYFVTIDTAGHNAFSSTYAQFLKDKAESQKALGYQ